MIYPVKIHFHTNENWKILEHSGTLRFCRRNLRHYGGGYDPPDQRAAWLKKNREKGAWFANSVFLIAMVLVDVPILVTLAKATEI